MNHGQTSYANHSSNRALTSKVWKISERLVSKFEGALKAKPCYAVIPAWKVDLKNTAAKYHFTAAWVGVIFNLVFGLADYSNSPQFFFNFMAVRVFVSATISLALVLYIKKQIASEILIFIAVLGISLQNAYMWSQMDIVLLQKHTLAYIALFIGAGMLVMWEMKYTITIVVLNLIGNIVAFNIFSPLGTQEVMASGGILTLSVAIFSILLIQTRYRLSKREIISRLALQQANVDLEEQKHLVMEKQQHITESIEYAKTIQEAILPGLNKIRKSLPQCGIFYRPLDIVSGDFYWCENVGEKTVVAAVDCTGHGVPGALMSMIGTTLLNEIVKVKGVTSPKEILNLLRTGVKDILSQEGSNAKSDSMDIALCTIDRDSETVTYAGAYNPLYLVRKGELFETKADKMPIGNSESTCESSFLEHSMLFRPGDMLYLVTDGFSDQFGGSRNKKYSSTKMKKFFASISSIPVERQKALIENEFDQWKGDSDQIDDALIICIRVGAPTN